MAEERTPEQKLRSRLMQDLVIVLVYAFTSGVMVTVGTNLLIQGLAQGWFLLPLGLYQGYYAIRTFRRIPKIVEDYTYPIKAKINTYLR